MRQVLAYKRLMEVVILQYKRVRVRMLHLHVQSTTVGGVAKCHTLELWTYLQLIYIVQVLTHLDRRGELVRLIEDLLL